MAKPIIALGAVMLRIDTDNSTVEVSADGGRSWASITAAANVPDGSITAAKLAPGVLISTDYRTHIYAIPGDIAVAAGDNNYILPFRVRLRNGQTAKLVGITHRQNVAGATVAVAINRNGADVAGLTAVVVGNAWTDTNLAEPLALADGDELQLVVSGITGAPKNMTVVLVLEVSV